MPSIVFLVWFIEVDSFGYPLYLCINFFNSLRSGLDIERHTHTLKGDLNYIGK